jgi:hypothetical protein
MLNDPTPLFVVPKGLQTRWASPENQKSERGGAAKANGGRKGSAWFPVKAGETRVLAEEKNTSGTIRRIWCTLCLRTPKLLRGMRIDIYWDGASTPAVSAPFGDFFGMTLGRMAKFQSALFSSPEGKSFNCFIPMPFRKGMKVTVTNETDVDQLSIYYDIDYTIGDAHDEHTAYFHAHFRRENPTTMRKDFEILPHVAGRGRFLGCMLGVRAEREEYCNAWWGEGEVKVFLDGDGEFPTLCGTGTEDYIGTGWGQGRFDLLYQGSHISDHKNFQFGFYRQHVPDPIYFHTDVRVTVQQIAGLDPDVKKRMIASGRKFFAAGPELKELDLAPEAPEWGLFERRDDWSCVAYFYLDRPTNDLPALPPVAERIADLPAEPPPIEGV